MPRKKTLDSIHQKNDAGSLSSKRGMRKRAMRNSNKRDRQELQRDLEKLIEDAQ